MTVIKQPGRRTQAYQTLLMLAGLTDKCVDLVYGMYDWGVFYRGDEFAEEFISRALLRRVLPFIAGERVYDRGSLVKIKNARVDVQVLPAKE